MAVIKRYFFLTLAFFFNKFPIKKNKIFIFSYYGGQYGGNPKYISEYIKNNDQNNRFDVVWAFNDINKLAGLKNIRAVKTMSLQYFYELCTSKVIITNYRTTEFFKKRKNQHYIQTWHSSLRLKQIEKDAESSLQTHYIKMAKKDSEKCDLLLSGCAYSTEIFKRAFWYNGAIFEHGTPRNDVLVQNHNGLKGKVLNNLGISKSVKIALYAPTFRKGDSIESYSMDYQKVIKSLEVKFGGNWLMFIKLHPHLISQSGRLNYGDNVMNVSTYDDTQELLSIADVLITDYSSLMFDFAITQRSCFLYVPDAEDYVSNERELYFDLEKLPFVMGKNNQDLIEKIESFNQQKYKENLTKFLDVIGSFEKGFACERLLEHLEKICFGENKRRALSEAV